MKKPISNAIKPNLPPNVTRISKPTLSQMMMKSTPTSTPTAARPSSGPTAGSDGVTLSSGASSLMSAEPSPQEQSRPTLLESVGAGVRRGLLMNPLTASTAFLLGEFNRER